MDPRFRGDDESGTGITAKLELFTRLPWVKAPLGSRHAFRYTRSVLMPGGSP